MQESQNLPASSHSDVQGDMARHEEEGSGNFRDESDDEEYSNIGGSGDGSGEGMFRFQPNQFYEFEYVVLYLSIY